MAGKKKGAKKRPRQQRIPGTEPEVHKDIIDAAEEYLDARTEMMETNEVFVAKRGALGQAMAKHGLERYRIPDSPHEVVITPGEATIRVKTVKEKKEKPEEGAEPALPRRPKSKGQPPPEHGGEMPSNPDDPGEGAEG